MISATHQGAALLAAPFRKPLDIPGDAEELSWRRRSTLRLAHVAEATEEVERELMPWIWSFAPQLRRDQSFRIRGWSVDRQTRENRELLCLLVQYIAFDLAPSRRPGTT